MLVTAAACHADATPAVPAPSYAPYTPPPAAATHMPPAPRQTGSRSADSEVPAAAPNWLAIVTSAGTPVLQTAVGRLTAPIQPDGSWGQVEPPAWNVADWITQTAAPASATRQLTAVYGHACHHHICSFDRLAAARVGDLVHLITPAGKLSYRVSEVSQDPKGGPGSLNALTRDAANTLVLVTCAYEQGDESLNNLVVAARLIAAQPRR